METGRYHLIDDQGNLNEGIEKYIKSYPELASIKKEFNIISVIGTQSSGKSTLLNHLFGTNFEVLNSKIGRQQTT